MAITVKRTQASTARSRLNHPSASLSSMGFCGLARSHLVERSALAAAVQTWPQLQTRAVVGSGDGTAPFESALASLFGICHTSWRSQLPPAPQCQCWTLALQCWPRLPLVPPLWPTVHSQAPPNHNDPHPPHPPPPPACHSHPLPPHPLCLRLAWPLSVVWVLSLPMNDLLESSFVFEATTPPA